VEREKMAPGIVPENLPQFSLSLERGQGEGEQTFRVHSAVMVIY
jgi:hypothetical protein